MKEWTEVLADRVGLSEEEIHWLTDSQERKSFAKNEIVVHKDEVDSNVYILTKGIWRAYHFKNGEEATAWFATPGELVFSTERKLLPGLPRRANWCFPSGAIFPTSLRACRSRP